MSTKPTRLQQQARDCLAQALVRLTDAHRLDGRGMLAPAEFSDLARRIAGVSSAFSLDEIVVKALELRIKALGLSAGAADLITLQDDYPEMLQTLLLADHEFIELVKRLEDELGVEVPSS